MVGLVVCCVPAFALSQQGHAFSRAFTVPGGPGGDTALKESSGVAVDEASGDVYVADAGNYRIVQLGPNGEFLSAWGYGVADGEDEFEVCKQNCRAGIAGKGEFQLRRQIQAIAVDNCTYGEDETCKKSGKECPPEDEACEKTVDPSVGDVYVATRYVTAVDEEDEAGREIVQKFGPDGKQLEWIEKVSYQEEGKQVRERLEAGYGDGLTVAPNGTVWLYYEERLFALSDERLNSENEVGDTSGQPLTVEVPIGAAPGVAVGADDTFYVGHDGYTGYEEHHPDVIAKEVLEEESETELEPVIEALDPENTTGLAADDSSNEADPSRGDVYLDQGDAIRAFDSAGAEVQRFGDEEEGEKGALQRGAGVAVDAQTDTVYAADAGAGTVDVYPPRVEAAPTVDSVDVREVTGESALLQAQIDTDGSQASYQFEYGTAPCSGSPTACHQVPKVQESPGSLLASFGDQGVEARLQKGAEGAEVLAGTTYYYRVVVADERGTVPSAEGSFTTLPEQTEGVADGRVWEMVSPPDKDGAGVEIGTPFYSVAGGRVAEAAEDGQALTYVTNGPVGQAEGNRGFEPTQMLSVRGAAGWQEPQDIVTPNEHAEGFLLGGGSEYRFFSSNLALAVVQPYNVSSRTRLAEPPLSPPTSQAERGHQEKTLYVRADGPIQPQGAQTALYGEAEENGKTMGDAGYGYVALVTGMDAPGAQFGSEPPESEPLLKFEGATADLGHVVLLSNVKGTACEPGAFGCVPELYEWSDGALHLVSRLPNGKANEPSEGQAALGSYELVRHAISDDGSRVFWSAGEEHLYMSDTASEPTQTTQVDTVQPGGSSEGNNYPVFQTASPDGSLALFTDVHDLTAGAGANQFKPDLYAYNASDQTLSDLTPCPRSEEDPATHKSVCVESAEVQGHVLGASEAGCDEGQGGCFVYFVANAVLCERENPQHECEAENARGERAAPGECGAVRPADTTCNLYVERREDGEWKPPTFIATLSNADRPDFEAKLANEATSNMMTSARVSPNGRYLSFMSERPLTGYDNHDATTGEADEEVFLYEAGSEEGKGRLVCASCDPSGARPTGVPDLPHQTSEAGAGLLVDRNGVWAEHRLAGSLPDWMAETQNVTNYQPRYLSNNGRLYFDSPSDLVPQATNGKEDVYEYEPAGVPQGAHRCTSASEAYSQRAEGCVALISSGTASGEAAFVDASETGGEGPGGEELGEGGGDAFFVTAAKLVPQDTDDSFDVYDAHECTRAESCFPAPEEQASTVCQGEECRPPAFSPPSAAIVASGSPSGQGNLPIKQGVSGQTVKHSPPTRAQELAKALASCRSKHKHSRKKRASCEHAARKRYGPVKKKKPAAKKAKRSDVKGGRRRGGGR
jgi:NHL repeat